MLELAVLVVLFAVFAVTLVAVTELRVRSLRRRLAAEQQAASAAGSGREPLVLHDVTDFVLSTLAEVREEEARRRHGR